MPDNYAQLGGLPWKADDQDQAAQMVQAGGQAISQQQAQEANKAQQDLSYVDDNWGVAGKAAMGGFSGLTLGMGPGALRQLGVLDQGHQQAAETSGWYTAGDVAGTLLPALFTGGESLLGRGLSMTPAGLMGLAGSGAEGLAGRLLGESAGLLGRLGSTPFKMAARGVTEGALISMGHTIGDNLIQNKPFTAESLAAIGGSGLDGALFGGLMGGSLGAVGSLGSMAVDSLGSLGKNVLGKTGAAEGYALKSLGIDAVAGADNKLTLKGAQEALERHGGGVGKSATKNLEASIEAKATFAAERTSAVTELERLGAAAPDINRLAKRLEGELLAPNLQTASEDLVRKEISSVVDSLKNVQPNKVLKAETPEMSFKDFEKANPSKKLKSEKPGMTEKEFLYSDTRPDAYERYQDYKSTFRTKDVDVKEPDLQARYDDYKSTFRTGDVNLPGPTPTWEKVIQSRDQLSKTMTGPMRADVLNIIDDEIARAMKVSTPGLEGVAEKYAAATQGLKMSETLEESLGKKVSNILANPRPAITGRDMAYAAAGAVAGHPGVALTALMGKGIASKLLQRIEPSMAKMAYNSAMGVKAANAASEVKSKIGSSLGNFFKTATQAPKRYAQIERSKPSGNKGYDRKSFEESASRTEQLISANHQDKVRRLAESMNNDGFGELAGAMMGVNNRAIQYLTWNAPPRAATKAFNSLRAQPVSTVLSHKEFQFMRMKKGVTDPLSLLDDLESGNLSRDSVQAMKYVYPEFHNELVLQAGTKIAEMKAEGKSMALDKIVTLGIALDSPLDSVLSGEYIGAVQVALNAPPPNAEPPAAPPMGPPGQMGPAIVMSQDMMTPLQTAQMNG